ncbi:MAG: hypothetical protein K9K37_00840 [Desulfocapsa sp.]|nr:hypothetical protein [Desulfocapsa sp.]
MSAENRYNSYIPLIFLLFLAIPLLAANIQGMEVNGEFSGEGFLFLENGAWSQQENQSASVAATIELHHNFLDNASFTLDAFYRLDSKDDARSHGDLRLAELLYFTDSWELTVGIGRVFWGATEFVHLVDIINQTDQVEAVDGEEKLGQPMVHFTVPRDWGTLEGFLLPWFRERTFPGIRGRFRTPVPVDTDQAAYESGSEQNHLDFALRYFSTLFNTDIGLSYFKGTSRDPALLLSPNQAKGAIIYPYYQQINQTGLDLQMVAGEWLLKSEAYYRTGQSRSYAATTFGVEYTMTGIGGSMMDLGLIAEYVFDDRDDGWLPTIYENDIMGGFRLSVNDMDDSSVLLGVVRDLYSGSTIIGIEASRRLGDSIRLNLDSSFFIDMDFQDPAFSLARDDFVRLEVIWYW